MFYNFFSKFPSIFFGVWEIEKVYSKVRFSGFFRRITKPTFWTAINPSESCWWRCFVNMHQPKKLFLQHKYRKNQFFLITYQAALKHKYLKDEVWKWKCQLERKQPCGIHSKIFWEMVKRKLSHVSLLLMLLAKYAVKKRSLLQLKRKKCLTLLIEIVKICPGIWKKQLQGYSVMCLMLVS